jgi:hypothetical protein
MILTISVPETHLANANYFAMALGYSIADGQTYGAPTWQDTAGNLYSAASLTVSGEFVQAATTALQRPAWDADEVVDLVAASRAQALVVLWLDGETTAPQASTNSITAIGGMSGLDALTAVGLAKVPTDTGFL